MAKRSRRTRKQDAEKRLQRAAAPETTPRPVEKTPKTPAAVSPEPVAVAGPAPRKAVNFAEEYYYVYSELRNIAVITVLMFALMFGLGFFI